MIGIPTVHRRRDYLLDTLDSLFAGLQGYDPSVQVIVLNVDPEPSLHPGFALAQRRYEEWIDRGVLRLEVADWITEDLPTTDRREQVHRWQSKQVLDCAATMSRCPPSAQYYLHLEDDVIAVPGFLRWIDERVRTFQRADVEWTILSFYNSHANPDGTSLSLFQLEHEYYGLIGKLFHRQELPRVTDYLCRRAEMAPADALIYRYVRETGGRVVTSSPSLFQHIGVVSSLPGRLQVWSACDYKESGLSRLRRRCGAALDVVRNHPDAIWPFLRLKHVVHRRFTPASINRVGG